MVPGIELSTSTYKDHLRVTFLPDEQVLTDVIARTWTASPRGAWPAGG